MTKRLEGRIALITGASRGIGAAVAKEFAGEGAHVILVARTVSGLEEVDDAIKTAGGEATLVPLDLFKYDKIDQLGGVIMERFGRLDILVGNAATLGQISPIGHIDPKVWEKTFALNVTANFRLIRSFDPLLRLSDAGRAVFVSSGVIGGDFPYWGGYAASKAALEQLVITYALEVEKTNVRANVIDPGVVATQMRAEVMPGEDQSKIPQPEDVARRFVDLSVSSLKDNGKIFRSV